MASSRAGVPPAILVRLAHQEAVPGRPIKLMCTWPKNDKGGFETRPYVLRVIARRQSASCLFVFLNCELFPAAMHSVH